jgi:hypothetical protein
VMPSETQSRDCLPPTKPQRSKPKPKDNGSGSSGERNTRRDGQTLPLLIREPNLTSKALTKAVGVAEEQRGSYGLAGGLGGT